MSQFCEFSARSALFRAEGRHTPDGWYVDVYRNGKPIADLAAPFLAVDEEALARTFANVRAYAEAGRWQPCRPATRT